MDMGFIGWIVVGFLAGSLSGWLIGDRTARGCLPTIVVGIVGGVVGGWIAREMDFAPIQGFMAAVVVATFGSILVRLVLRALEGGRRV